VNKIIVSVITTAIALALSFALINFTKAPPEAADDINFCVTAEKIKASFLGSSVNVEDIPSGFYAWHSQTPAGELYKDNELILNGVDSEAVYKNFKFKNQNGAWIKFIVTAGTQIIFTSSGLISSGGSNNLDVLETISNKIKTSINESKVIKLSPGGDQSAFNISAAIYNAVKDKMSVGAAADFRSRLQQTQISPAVAEQISRLKDARISDIYIAGKKRGVYFESYLPGCFNKVKIGFVIKNTFHIAQIFILTAKKNQFTAGAVRDENFIGSFNRLLIGDVRIDNANIYKESGARPEHYTNKYRVIKFMSDIFPLIKIYISRSRD
jgi:hypothetical protein